MAVVGTGSSVAPLPPSGPKFGSRRAGSCGVARTIEQCGATAVRSSTSSSGGTEEHVDLVVWQRNPHGRAAWRGAAQGTCSAAQRRGLRGFKPTTAGANPQRGESFPSSTERPREGKSQYQSSRGERGGFGCLNSVGCWS
jgi:hypothetical protein